MNRGTINNQHGLIQASHDVKVNTGRVDNQHNKQTGDKTQGILAGNEITINTNTLDNQSGQILANKNITASANTKIDNASGVISAETVLLGKDNAQLTVDNKAGEILANTQATIDAKQYNNNGLLKADTVQVKTINGLSHNASSNIQSNHLTLDTQGTFNNTSKLLATDISIHATNIHNHKGASIISGATTELTATDKIDNRGLINGSNTYLNTDSTLTNHSYGRIYGDHIAIKADTLTNAPDNSSVKRTQISKAECQASSNCVVQYTLTSPKDNTKVTFGYDYSKTPSQEEQWLLDHTNKADYSVSYYQVDASPAPVIASRKRLDIGVNTLNNLPNKARSGIFNSDFNDQASIISNGEMHIGGKLDNNHQATGQATLVVNKGATIQSLGKMTIDTNTLRNENADWSSQAVVESKTSKTTYAKNTDSRQYEDNPKTIEKRKSKRGAKDAVLTGINPDGSKVNLGENWYEFKFNEVVLADRVNSSDASRIVSGGDLSIHGTDLLNDKSQLNAGINAKLDAVNLKDTDIIKNSNGVRDVDHESLTGKKVLYVEDGTFRYHKVKWKNRLKRKHKNDWTSPSAYTPAAKVVSTYKLPILNVDINSVATGKYIEDNNVDQLSTIIKLLTTLDKGSSGQTAKNEVKNITIDVAGVDTLTALTTSDSHVLSDAQKKKLKEILNQKANGSSVDKAKVNGLIAQINEEIRNQQQEIRTNDSHIKLPNSSLYSQNPDSKAKYLIETDPNFTNYDDWLSSDYLLDQLDLDPDDIHKRLGDGYYEQELIRDQINQLTGRYYLGDYQTNDQQYKGLMDAGVTFAKAHQLRPGIALTDAQMAQLTTDIVWLVKQTVTLADGSSQTVLVPRVYTKQAVGRINGTGNLITAKNVQLDLKGKLNNSGQIVASDRLNIKTHTLTNQDGGLVQGNFVQINTTDDLNNLGATIKADSAMQLDVGGDLNNSSTTYHTKSAKGKSTGERTGIDQIASIYIGSKQLDKTDEDGNFTTTFVAKVAGNTDFNTGVFDNRGGNSFIIGKKDINLNATNSGYQTNAIADDNNYYQQGASQDIGSRLTGMGNIILKGKNVTGKATTIASDTGKTTIIAKNDITFTDGRQKSNLSTASKVKDKGFLSSSTTQDTYNIDSDHAITTNIEGNKVHLQAGNDINLTATNVISDPLSSDDLRKLGLEDMANDLSKKYGRDVNFMIFDNAENAIKKAPSIEITR